jgi:hypothetical protein
LSGACIVAVKPGVPPNPAPSQFTLTDTIPSSRNHTLFTNSGCSHTLFAGKVARRSPKVAAWVSGYRLGVERVWGIGFKERFHAGVLSS